MVEGNQHTSTETETRFTNVRESRPESDVGRLRELWRIMFGDWRKAHTTSFNCIRESEYSWDYVDMYYKRVYENKDGDTFAAFEYVGQRRVTDGEYEMA